MIIDKKFDRERNMLSTKEDISLLRHDLWQLQVKMEQRFTTTIVTLVTTSVAIAGIAIAILKL